MNRLSIVSLTCLITLTAASQSTVRLNISTSTPHDSVKQGVYVAGSFNGWNPKDEKFRSVRSASGLYTLDMLLPAGEFEFKITRGSWQSAECRADGAPITNRILRVQKNDTVNVNVEEWADKFPDKPRTHTASKQVCILDSNFMIPQLKRTRRVWLYLPKSYCDGTNRRYPVLYLQDGQNIFDDVTSFSGEWGIDEFLDTTKLPECIVVAVDHGNEKRLTEYNPYDHEKYGRGEGAAYAKFLAKTLKPFIDKHYRTLPAKGQNFIAGSSMGGLISFYTVLKYPKVFGGAGIFSPAFQVAGQGLFADITRYAKKFNGSIFFYAGKLEGDAMVPDVLRAYQEMSKLSAAKMVSVIRDSGQHTESAWKKEFPQFYRWIMTGDLTPGK